MISQSVPGTRNVTIYPYLRKIDLMSSNSYLLSSPSQIALIDPGGMESQINRLEEEIQILQDELSRPLVVYLTHVHIDHWQQLLECKKSSLLAKAFLAVQEKGAQALETNDPRMTLSMLLDRSMSAFPVDIRLLTDQDKAILCGNSLDLMGWRFDYVTKSWRIAEDIVLYGQIVPFGREDHLEIYHTPGHSPDSVCIRIGSLLLVGDIFFASNPGMAGAYGWNRDDLMQSILKILWILENEKILLCGGGHGKFIDAQTARKTLQVMYSDAASLKDLQEITPLWARRISDYAQDLISEMERIFTIIAGRLTYISHVLEKLEEEAQAKELDCLMDIQYMDELLVDFHCFARELKAGKKIDWEMVHKTGQVVGRLDKLLAKRKLESVLDQSLLDRASRLLSDYAAIYRGFRPPYIVSRVDVNRFVELVLEKLLHNVHKEEAIMQAESAEDFLQALRHRIAQVNIFDGVNLVFLPGSGEAFARMDQERFAEILIDMLERFAGARMRVIEIATALNDEWLMVRITGRSECSCHPLSRSKRFFERNLALSGGLLQISLEANRPSVEIEFAAFREEG
ncbi:MAG: MBL fold metallo-hydrolase [Methanothrix sp.]|nr:MBL fold metallo-hydrolase [Methanothrix sp.]MDD4446709.1 MBL fold metallo-hydrolase [Methanothrix sp.]